MPVNKTLKCDDDGSKSKSASTKDYRFIMESHVIGVRTTVQSATACSSSYPFRVELCDFFLVYLNLKYVNFGFAESFFVIRSRVSNDKTKPEPGLNFHATDSRPKSAQEEKINDLQRRGTPHHYCNPSPLIPIPIWFRSDRTLDYFIGMREHSS